MQPEEAPRANATREPIDQIALEDNQTDAEGWPYALLLGTDRTRGWSFECDMRGGKLCTALTPAGQDAMFLIAAEQVSTGPGDYDHATTAEIAIDGAFASWDPDARRLTVWNDAPPTGAEERERMNQAAPRLLAALKAIVAIADRQTVEFDEARAAIAQAEAR